MNIGISNRSLRWGNDLQNRFTFKKNIMAKLLHKIHITGKLQVMTGLHIGGSEVELDIGGIDSEVVKVKIGNDKVPYIPDSSLKGKLRNLLAKREGYATIKDDKGYVLRLFGKANTGRDKMIPARLIVRDAYLSKEFKAEDMLEDKAENVIARDTGRANPRHQERVTMGTTFALDIIMDVLRDDSETKHLNALDLGFQLLQKDYLGGSGTRGYGKNEVSDVKAERIEFLTDGKLKKTENIHDFEVNKETA